MENGSLFRDYQLYSKTFQESEKLSLEERQIPDDDAPPGPVTVRKNHHLAEGSMGSHFGKLFSTPDDAAIAAIQDIVQQSIKEKVEFAGRIFGLGNGKFMFTAPNRGVRDDSFPGPRVAGKVNVGTYHTHGGEFQDTDEVFSPMDMVKATFGKEVSYLGTPCQRTLKFTPIDLLPPEEQQANPGGRVDVLVSVYTLPEVVIEGSPG